MGIVALITTKMACFYLVFFCSNGYTTVLPDCSSIFPFLLARAQLILSSCS